MSSNKYGRTQVGGSCWFETFVNGFLFTGPGHVLLVRLYNAYERRNNKNAKLRNFWAYVFSRLKRENTRKNTHVALAIKSIMPKVSLSEACGVGGSFMNYIDILKLIFPGKTDLIRINIHYGPSAFDPRVSEIQNVKKMAANNTYNNNKFFKNIKPYILLKIKSDIQNKTTPQTLRRLITTTNLTYTNFEFDPSSDYSTDFELNNCYILKQNHAVCGYIGKDKKQYIFDSATGQTTQTEWTGEIKDAEFRISVFINKRIILEQPNSELVKPPNLKHVSKEHNRMLPLKYPKLKPNVLNVLSSTKLLTDRTRQKLLNGVNNENTRRFRNVMSEFMSKLSNVKHTYQTTNEEHYKKLNEIATNRTTRIARENLASALVLLSGMKVKTNKEIKPGNIKVFVGSEPKPIRNVYSNEAIKLRNTRSKTKTSKV
jgi:hypothetical protein